MRTDIISSMSGILPFRREDSRDRIFSAGVPTGMNCCRGGGAGEEGGEGGGDRSRGRAAQVCFDLTPLR